MVTDGCSVVELQYKALCHFGGLHRGFSRRQRKHLMASHHSKFISPATVGVPAAVMQYPLQGLL